MKRMLMVCAVALAAFCATAETWTDPETGITWTYIVNGNVASVGSGFISGTAVPQTTIGAIAIPAAIGGYTVTSIGDWAFYNCRCLTSVTIPSTVSNIGVGAFCDCSELMFLTIPSSVMCIGAGVGVGGFCDGCTSLRRIDVQLENANYSSQDGVLFDKFKSVLFQYPGGKQGSYVIPSGVRSIGANAFCDCMYLTSVTIPSTVTGIEEFAFWGCDMLQSFTVDSGNSTYSSYGGVLFNKRKTTLIQYPQGKQGVYSIPSSVTVIGDKAFFHCTYLTGVTIPKGVVSIGQEAFSNSGLTSVTIPSSVTSIGVKAFQYCTRLTSVTMSDGVTSIGAYAFQSCSSLTSVTIPSSVNSVGYYAFKNCTELTAVYISNLSEWCRISFQSCDANPLYYANNLYLNGETITDLVVPPDVSRIGMYAFNGCSGLTRVTIPSSVQSIGAMAFYSCGALTCVVIPACVARLSETFPQSFNVVTNAVIAEGVTSVGSAVFSGCSSLKSVTIPDSVTKVDAGAFAGCNSLAVAYIPYSLSDVSAFPSTCKILRRVGVIVRGKKVECLYDGKAHEPDWEYSPDIGCMYIGTNKWTCAGNYELLADPNDFYYDKNKYVASISVESPCIVTIAKRSATVTSEGAEKQYDGTEIVLPDVVIDGDGFVEGECDVEAVGRLVDVGCCTNDIVISWRSEDLESNYSIITNEGVFSITARPVSVVSDGAEKVYDGIPLTAGYKIGGLGFVAGECEVSATNSQTCVGVMTNEVRFSWLGAGKASNYDLALTNGLLVVTARPVSVSAQSAEKVYDGTPLTAGVEIGGMGFVDGECEVSGTGSQTTVGSSENGVQLNWMGAGVPTNYDIAITNGTLTVKPAKVSPDGREPGEGEVPAGGISKYDTTATYDGVGHTIDTNRFASVKLIDPISLSYSMTSNGVYRPEPILFTNACVTSVWYKISAANYEDYIHEAKVTVLPRGVTLTSGSAEKRYDGAPLVCHEYTIGGDGFVDGEGVEMSYTGSQTLLGTSENTFTHAFAEGTLADNYDVTTSNGTLTVFHAGKMEPPMIIEHEFVGESASIHFAPVGEGVTIRYTTDGSVPTPSSTLYEGAVGVTDTTRIRAIACKYGWVDSDPSDETVRCTAGVVEGDYDSIAERYPNGYADMTNVIIRGKTELPASFFAGCRALRSVTLPDELRSIDANSFDAMPNFQWKIVDGYKFYSNWLFGYTNDAVEELTHTDTLKGVANGALDGCKNIEAFTCKEASPLTYIGKAAFRGCKNLERVALPTGLQEIAAFAFANDYYLDTVVVPDGVEEIGAGAFSNCVGMASITFGKGLKDVGDSAFENCIELRVVVFQEGLASLGARAFFAASGSRLQSVSLPASLESVGQDAFASSALITGVTVPTHVDTLAILFPNSYQKIESVVIPEGEGVIMDAMFQGSSALTSIIIPVSVTNVGESAFADCVALVEQGLPDEVTTLGARAFEGCAALKTVSLPRKLKAISDGTFAACPMLDSLVVPASVKSLGHNVYSGAMVESEFVARLTGIYYLGDAPEVVYSDSYAGTPLELKSYIVNGSKGWIGPDVPGKPLNGWPTCGNTRDVEYWTPNEFEVTFDGNGGSPETYVSKQITDTTYSLPKSDPVRDGYLFKGWWTEREAGAQIYWNTRVTATKAHTLYAHWKSMTEMITVIFHPNGGTVEPSEKKYPPGVTFGELPVPTRIGHNFVGWYTSQVGGDLVDESTPVTKENNELYAHWEPITYSVAFDANGGLGEMKLQTHTYNVPQALSSNAYYLVGFNFTGWSETRGGVVKYANKQVVENLEEVQGRVRTLYAVWAGAKYSVRFDANGGEGIMGNQTHQIGVRQALSKCTFTRKGYSFLGWATTPKGVVEYGDEEEVKNLTMQASATVPLYAVWSPNPYSIAYDANGGTGTMSPTACLYDKEATIPACGFAKAGYSFTGWATSAEGAVVYTPGQKVLNLTDEAGKVITLFAVWEQASVEVPVFSPKDGTVFTGSCTVTLTCPTPGASIYYRIGAKPKATSKYLYSEPFEITETSTVYAFAKLGDTESDCVTATYTKGKVITFEEAVKAKGITAFTHGGDAVWGVEEGLGEGNVCVRSGVIIDEQVSWFETTVEGPGTISFKWKASCEEDYPSHEWDHLEFRIDGKDNGRLDGVTDWVEVSKKLKTGTHTLTWLYLKDESDYEGEDCGWVDCVTWVADAPAPVPPGGEIDVPKGKTAKEFADEVNKNKAQYLNWPLEGPVSTDYLGCFTAVPKGDAKVEFVLSEEGTNQVIEATTAAKTNTLESVLSKTGTLVIGDPLIGFYYSLKQGSDVTVGDKADLNKLAGRDALSFPLTTDKSKYFYQSLVTPTPVPTK